MNNKNSQVFFNPVNIDASQKSTMSDTLRPTMCIRRDENTYVPLIAVDELPDFVQLIGIPTSMSQNEMVEAGMAFKGHQPSHGKYYGVEYQHSFSSSTSETSQSSQSSEDTTKDFQAPDKKEKGQDIIAAKGEKNGTQEQTDSLSVNSGRAILSTKRTGNTGTLGKKVYCTYFLQTGNCNYMQEGCKYKHEFPDDEETRSAIGLRKLPTWMRDDPAVPVKPIKPAVQQRSWKRHDPQAQTTEATGTAKASNGSTLPLATAPIPTLVNARAGMTRDTAAPPKLTQQRVPSSSTPSHTANNTSKLGAQLPAFLSPQQKFPSSLVSRDVLQHSPFHEHHSAYGNNNGPQSLALSRVGESFSCQLHSNAMNAPQQSTGTSAVQNPRSTPAQAPISRPVSTQQLCSSPSSTIGHQQNNFHRPQAMDHSNNVYRNHELNGPRSAFDGVHGSPAFDKMIHETNIVAPIPSNYSNFARLLTPSTTQASSAKALPGQNSFAGNSHGHTLNHGMAQMNINTQASTPASYDSAAQSRENSSGSNKSAQNASTIAQHVPIESPAPMHRRLFIAPGEERYVSNPRSEIVHQKGRGTKKRGASKGKRGSPKGAKEHKAHAQSSESLI